MAIRTLRSAVKYECDSCHAGVITEPGDEPPGIGGSVREVHATGATSDLRWWACKREHIHQAIINVLGKS